MAQRPTTVARPPARPPLVGSSPERNAEVGFSCFIPTLYPRLKRLGAADAETLLGLATSACVTKPQTHHTHTHIGVRHKNHKHVTHTHTSACVTKPINTSHTHTHIGVRHKHHKRTHTHLSTAHALLGLATSARVARRCRTQ